MLIHFEGWAGVRTARNSTYDRSTSYSRHSGWGESKHPTAASLNSARVQPPLATDSIRCTPVLANVRSSNGSAARRAMIKKSPSVSMIS